METQTKEVLDLREKGAPKNGVRQTLDKRLFIQLQAFGGCRDSAPLASALQSAGVPGALYEDVNDPTGVAVVAASEDPSFFTATLRGVLNKPPFLGLAHKPEYSMLGRTYAIGYEPNLEDWVLERSRRTITGPDHRWGVWYPLRRTGAFSLLSHEEQGQILKEHGMIGRTFGEAGFASDIRLACAGLDKNDNDFVIGLVGKELYPLSAVVAAMRTTKQTSTYIQNMGPFFVGKTVWQSQSKA